MLTGVLKEQTTRIGKTFFYVIVGIFIGYLYRSHELSINTVTYTDVLVKEKIADNHFKLQPARMIPIESKLCYSTVDWKQGEILCLLKFEQLKGCKRIIAYDRQICKNKEGELRASD